MKKFEKTLAQSEQVGFALSKYLNKIYILEDLSPQNHKNYTGFFHSPH